ncbi:DEAD/DEAH box helicase [Actibacterium lipolyticum]|uniref:DEAD/DEAH box helicase n=1 Tax=Actibacterium lipolyticum TaxID=1524263 RepID=UPI001F4348CF|nr:DEAD/DEAH box helicase [Actibacterium lipolyticum]
MTDFSMLGLAPRLLSALEAQGFTDPTPIQAQAIPHILEGRDLMGLAQTGTGKTAAFGLPLIHGLMENGGKPDPKSVRALILAPTRELVNQIADNLSTFVTKTPINIACVVGGASINNQIKRLNRGADILVATPGRLLDLIDRKALTLNKTGFLVLDEADQMLDLGFIHALRQISKFLPKERQTLLFSATMPKQMNEIAQTYLDRPVRVQVSPPGKAADKVTQCVHFVEQSAKSAKLKQLLADHSDELTLVFGRTKHGCERLMKQLDAAGFSAGSIHGNKSQGQRERTLKAFRDGKIKVLVATDVAARGIDIPGVAHVYNYDLPNVAENYVHRIGRTARAGADGAAVAFCSPDEIGELRSIEKVMGISIPVASGQPPAEEQKPKRKGPSGNKGRGRRPQRGRGGKGQRMAA